MSAHKITVKQETEIDDMEERYVYINICMNGRSENTIRDKEGERERGEERGETSNAITIRKNLIHIALFQLTEPFASAAFKVA